ncbi:phosphotransferase system, EIIC family protein, partial [Vibrio parahaemolyticus EKP-028]|jgi:putative transposase
VDLS